MKKKTGHIKKPNTILCAIAVGVTLCFYTSSPANAAGDVRQYKIEAAFLYNFFNYITWPGQTSPETLKQAHICLAADDPMQPYLEYVTHKKLLERTIIIQQVEYNSDLEGCHILFLRNVNKEAVSPLLVIAEEKGILLVSEKDGFVDEGGMIGLVPQEQRVALDMHLTNMKLAGLQVSSRLLNLARKVR